MEKITAADLMNIYEYEKVRDEERREIMAHKARRRVNLGPEVTLTFEDRQTMIFQIHEMMRAERMVRDEVIQEEIDVYNTLIPEEGELSATLFIEITEQENIREKLHQFLGLTDGDSLWLQVGDEKVFATFEEGRSEEDRISSVHYIRFAVPGQVQEMLADPESEAAFVIAQGDYRYRTPLTEAVWESLLGDLQAIPA